MNKILAVQRLLFISNVRNNLSAIVPKWSMAEITCSHWSTSKFYNNFFQLKNHVFTNFKINFHEFRDKIQNSGRAAHSIHSSHTKLMINHYSTIFIDRDSALIVRRTKIDKFMKKTIFQLKNHTLGKIWKINFPILRWRIKISTAHSLHRLVTIKMVHRQCW